MHTRITLLTTAVLAMNPSSVALRPSFVARVQTTTGRLQLPMIPRLPAPPGTIRPGLRMSAVPKTGPIVQVAHGWRWPLRINFSKDGLLTPGTPQHAFAADPTDYTLSTLDWRAYSNNVNIFQVQHDPSGGHQPRMADLLHQQHHPEADILVGHSLGSQVVLRLCDDLLRRHQALPGRVVLLDPAFVKPFGLAGQCSYNRCATLVHTLTQRGVRVTLVKSSELPEALGVFLHRYGPALLDSVSDFHLLPTHRDGWMRLKASHDHSISYFFHALLPRHLEYDQFHGALKDPLNGFS